MEIYLDEIASGLYQIQPVAAAQDTYAYFLLLNAGSSLQPPSLDETWNDPTLVGWYIFLPEQIPQSQAESFAQEARQLLPPVVYSPTQTNIRAIVWLAGIYQLTSLVDYVVFYQLSSQAPPRAPIASRPFSWGGFCLQLTTKANIALDEVNGAFQFNTTSDSVGAIQIFYNNQATPLIIGYYGGQGWSINIPFLGSDTGTLMFSIGLDWGSLCANFGCGFNYVYPSQDDYVNLFYPLFAPTDPNNSGATYQFLGFNIKLHPLYPADPSHTQLALDLTSNTNPYTNNSQNFSSGYLQTISGESITLIPHNPVASPPNPPVSSSGSPDDAQLPTGFYFAKAPAAVSPVTSPPDYNYYLAPVGLFRVTAITPPSSLSAPGKKRSAKKSVSKKSLAAQKSLAVGDPVQLMCGLFAQEFLQIEIGDLIEFEPCMPAWASGFSGVATSSQQPGSSKAQTLEADFTTSWMRYPVGQVEGMRGYFAQPSASVYYANADESQVYPTAVNSLLSVFPEPVSFPLIPYGGIYATSVPNGVIAFNANVSPAAFDAFEAAVLSSVRHSNLAANSEGPIFLQPTRTARHSPLHQLSSASALTPMPFATTPQGLLVQLNLNGNGNTAGTWNTVFLARSPDEPSKYLSFEPPANSGVISIDLSNALVQNQLFMVVSNPTGLGQFNNELSLCRFNFLLDVSVEDTILIFKFNTSKSLKELIAQPTLWAESDTFVGGSPSDIEATQNTILSYIQTAEDDATASGNPFGYFNWLVNQPQWTGILAMHCAIDGKGMPPDLLMLLGGINGQLRAHHFGIETNRIETDGGLHLKESSLFGVIYYENETPPDIDPSVEFAYAVETLTVVFRNSNITQFATKIGLTINNLFSREVELISEAGLSSPMLPNTLIISGQYQTQDGVGTLTFTTDSPITYRFTIPEGTSRVLDQIEFTQVSLIPLSAGDASSPQETVQANFNLSGQLWFHPAPFKGSDDIDLFSYGTYDSPSIGMAFTGLVINMSFELDATGALIAGSETLTLQPSLLSFTPASEAIREGSLLNSLPLQLSRFWYAPEGLSASQLGANPIHVLQLESANRAESPPPPGGYPFVTTTPQFALEYDLPLGSLGSLSDVHAGLTAKLLLAWGPSQVVPDSDAAAVLVQLPQAMAGYGGFNLEGILKTTFGDANLLKVDLESGLPVYAVLFNNIKLSVFGYSFPPGVLIDFVIFAGQPESNQSTNTSNIAWFLAATQPGGSPSAK